MQDKIQRFTASNYYISQMYHLAVKRNLDTAQLLADAEIYPDLINKPGERIDADKLAKFVQGLWDALQDESMSLSSSPIPRGSFIMMGKLTIHEPNLGKALSLACRFYNMVTDAFEMTLETRGNRALVEFKMKSPELDENHLFAEINLMGWHRYSSWLIAENVPLTEVYFDYPVPNQVAEYSYLFPGRHIFDACTQGFSFPKKFLDFENVQNPHSLKTFLNRCPKELFLQPKTDFSLSSELNLLLNRRFRDGFPSIEDAADAIHMTKRTMIRKLKEEGTSYQHLKDLVRRDRAIQLLTQQALTVGEVAEKIGFSDSAVFARAFKSWTGLSPRQYRVNYGQTES